VKRLATKVLVALGLLTATVVPAAAPATNQVLQLSPVPDLRGTLVGSTFQVVRSESWPAGLVPLFGVQEDQQFVLQRLPVPGQAISSEPIFFALPPEDEPRAADIAGHWICTATNVHRPWHEPHWELAIEGERIAGRFSQDGEYRVASISGGTFRSNRFELNVEWINDRYQLTGEWRSNKLSGMWRQIDEEERGVWTAVHSGPVATIPKNAQGMRLYEWHRTGQRKYSIASKLDEPGWQRAARPLCRVWKKP
jgi:hypothetical protein